MLTDPALGANVGACGADIEMTIALRDADDSLLAAVSTGDVPEIDVEVTDTDLVQLLYTSGTTSRPKGAMMTHRAFVHEYLSCILAMDCRSDDEPLHAMPLYHSAGMHVFMLPYLAVGATNHLMEAPDIQEILRRIETDRSARCSSWIEAITACVVTKAEVTPAEIVAH